MSRATWNEVARPPPHSMQELQLFVVRLGAALNAVGEPVYVIQERLARIAAAYGASEARVTAFPTSLLVSPGGEPITLELATPVVGPARLEARGWCS